MFVLKCECMRRRYLGLHDMHITVPDLLLAAKSLPASCTYKQDYVMWVYAMANHASLNKVPVINFSMGTEIMYTQASQQLNILSGQPLSLSLTDDIRSDQPSWSTNWETRIKRFLFNQSASSFSASKQPDSDHPFTEITRPLDSTEPLHLKYTGLVVDVIRKLSDYLPPRRHCDHYNLSDNCFFFINWYEFAKDCSHLTEDTILLDYADTIQARGCGHLWENLAIPSQDRIQKARAFLNFLTDEDAEGFDATHSVRLFHAACFPSHDRRFAVTKNGRFCLVPKATQCGDLVCIPRNSRVPYIFRPLTEGYENIGETYVHGIMHGETSETEGLEETEFLLY